MRQLQPCHHTAMAGAPTTAGMTGGQLTELSISLRIFISPPQQKSAAAPE